MRSKLLILMAITALASFPVHVNADMISLGTAGDFAVLAGSTVTNTGSTVISGGDVGVSTGTAITGFPPGTIAAPYTSQSNTALAMQAQSDLTTAYNTAAGLMPTDVLTGQNLGGLTLTPGVYFFASTAELTGILTLNDEGNPNAQFVFQIGSALTIDGSASVVTIGSGTVQDTNVFWQVGTSATLGTGSAFEGNILANMSITLDTGATIIGGRALAQNAAVTLDANTITAAAVPEPSTMTLALIGGALLGLPVIGKRFIQR